MIRVLIADDHPLVRSGFRALIDSFDGVELVGEAANGIEAIELAENTHPDVVVMDLQMPVLDGIEATRRLIASLPDIAVLVLTMHEDDESVFAAMRVGARGYLLKGAGQDDIRRAIEAVNGGEAIFGPRIAARLVGFFAASAEVRPAFPELTVREREILNLLAVGSSNSEIARTLFLSSKTVSNHVSNIFAKLQVADRAKAIVRARNAGLGVPPAPDHPAC